MPINKNHEFEELDGVKCSIAERNAPAARVDFLKHLLQFNGYTVVVVASPPARVAPVARPVVPAAITVAGNNTVPEVPAVEAVPVYPLPAVVNTFTIGVTNVMFNPTNAVFGRLLRTRSGHVVTLAYWEQKETISHDEIPYFENVR